MSNHLHPLALVESGATGDGLSVAAFAYIADGALVGRHVEVAEHASIAAGARVGDRVTVAAGARVGAAATIEEEVSVGPNAVVGDVERDAGRPAGPSVIMTRALIAAGAVVGAGVTVGRDAVVEAGAIVTKDVPPFAIVTGNPAQITGYVGGATLPTMGEREADGAGLPEGGVEGAELIDLTTVDDIRGSLTYAEVGSRLPFTPERFFVVYGVPGPEVRGEHAHRQLEELLVCVAGSCSVSVDDGTARAKVRLDSPAVGLHLNAMVWRMMYRFSADARLLVLASLPYDPDDYIRDYEDFLREREAWGRA